MILHLHLNFYFFAEQLSSFKEAKTLLPKNKQESEYSFGISVFGRWVEIENTHTWEVQHSCKAKL